MSIPVSVVDTTISHLQQLVENLTLPPLPPPHVVRNALKHEIRSLEHVRDAANAKGRTLADLRREMEEKAIREGRIPTKRNRSVIVSYPEPGTQRRAVLDALAEAPWPGLTDPEISERTGISANSARPRRVSLVQGGLMEDTGEVREINGHKHIVWRATDRALVSNKIAI